MISISFIIFYALAAEPVQAGFFSRVQDIYHAPDKIGEIEQQYKEANEELSQQLEQSQQTTEELARKQDELLEQNRQLMERNSALQAEIEQARHKKDTFQRKLYMGGAIVAGLFAAYFMAIRIWRYASWRRQKAFREGGISG